MPLFSVIIPNYNHADFLVQRIETILCQTFQDFEIIILDDASNDNSRSILDKYRDHTKVANIIYNTTNSGSPFAQWKKGIEHAKGEWIWIAESDDYADNAFLQEAISFINAYPSADIFYCDAFIVNENNNLLSRFSEKKNQYFKTGKWTNTYIENGIEEINTNLKFICTVNNASSTIFRKKKAELFLQELQKFQYHGDWFFYLSICFTSKICYSNKPLNYYRDYKRSHLSASGFQIKKKVEYFLILKLLYHQLNVSNKKELIHHFTGNYLSFGLLKDGLLKGIFVLYSYLKLDFKLGLLVLSEFVKIKVFRKKFERWYD